MNLFLAPSSVLITATDLSFDPEPCLITGTHSGAVYAWKIPQLVEALRLTEGLRIGYTPNEGVTTDTVLDIPSKAHRTEDEEATSSDEEGKDGDPDSDDSADELSVDRTEKKGHIVNGKTNYTWTSQFLPRRYDLTYGFHAQVQSPQSRKGRSLTAEQPTSHQSTSHNIGLQSPSNPNAALLDNACDTSHATTPTPEAQPHTTPEDRKGEPDGSPSASNRSLSREHSHSDSSRRSSLLFQVNEIRRRSRYEVELGLPSDPEAHRLASQLARGGAVAPRRYPPGSSDVPVNPIIAQDVPNATYVPQRAGRMPSQSVQQHVDSRGSELSLVTLRDPSLFQCLPLCIPSASSIYAQTHYLQSICVVDQLPRPEQCRIDPNDPMARPRPTVPKGTIIWTFSNGDTYLISSIRHPVPVAYGSPPGRWVHSIRAGYTLCCLRAEAMINDSPNVQLRILATRVTSNLKLTLPYRPYVDSKSFQACVRTFRQRNDTYPFETGALGWSFDGNWIAGLHNLTIDSFPLPPSDNVKENLRREAIMLQIREKFDGDAIDQLDELEHQLFPRTRPPFCVDIYDWMHPGGITKPKARLVLPGEKSVSFMRVSGTRVVTVTRGCKIQVHQFVKIGDLDGKSLPEALSITRAHRLAKWRGLTRGKILAVLVGSDDARSIITLGSDKKLRLWYRGKLVAKFVGLRGTFTYPVVLGRKGRVITYTADEGVFAVVAPFPLDAEVNNPVYEQPAVELSLNPAVVGCLLDGSGPGSTKVHSLPSGETVKGTGVVAVQQQQEQEERS